MRTELGKIQKVLCGIGGCQDAMLGIAFVLGGEAWGVHTPFIGSWCPGIIDPTQRTEWTETDRDESFAKAMRKLGEILREAKRTDISQLVGVPIEATFDDQRSITSWRVLKEVL